MERFRVLSLGCVPIVLVKLMWFCKALKEVIVLVKPSRRCLHLCQWSFQPCWYVSYLCSPWLYLRMIDQEKDSHHIQHSTLIFAILLAGCCCWKSWWFTKVVVDDDVLRIGLNLSSPIGSARFVLDDVMKARSRSLKKFSWGNAWNSNQFNYENQPEFLFYKTPLFQLPF